MIQLKISTLNKKDKEMYPSFYLLNFALLSILEGLINLFLMFANKRIDIIDKYLDYILHYQLKKLK